MVLILQESTNIWAFLPNIYACNVMSCNVMSDNAMHCNARQGKVCTYVWINEWVDGCMHACMYLYVPVCTCMCVYVHVCVCVYIHIIYIYTYILIRYVLQWQISAVYFMFKHTQISCWIFLFGSLHVVAISPRGSKDGSCKLS